MTTAAEQAAPAAWYGAEITRARLASALGCAVDDVQTVIAAYGADRDCPSMSWLTGRQMIGLSVAIGLHRQAGIALSAAADFASGRWRICDSVLAVVDFVPPPDENATRAAAPSDPFMFFAAHASEAVAVPAIDEFIDVMDGRRIWWRRPRRDVYRLACELHRLSEALGREETPPLREQYLELLGSLRGSVEHTSEWIGTVGADGFRPAPERFAEAFPAMRQRLDSGPDASRFPETYGTRVSINVSLAARSFKRRILGLPVMDPFR